MISSSRHSNNSETVIGIDATVAKDLMVGQEERENFLHENLVMGQITPKLLVRGEIGHGHAEKAPERVL